MAVLCTKNQQFLHSNSHELTKQFEVSRELWPSSWDLDELAAPIPNPALFQDLVHASGKSKPDALPTVSECAAHLELLHAIDQMRQSVLNSTLLDEIMQIKPQKRTVIRYNKTVEVRDKTFVDRRKNKWSFYVKVSVVRFFLWLKFMDQHLSLAESHDSAATLELPFCPPLDVLLAWHSALLNPAWFRNYCAENGLSRTRRVVFPWAKIHQSINSDNWHFCLHPDAINQSEYMTGQKSDLLSYLQDPKSAVFKEILQFFGEGASDKTKIKKLRMQIARHPVRHQFFTRVLHVIRPDAPSQYLYDAVERQLSFVGKMVKFLWIRSPAVRGTLEHAIDRYDHFLQLFKLRPNTMLVPTVDIDLVWHTHQCSAALYERSMQLRAGRFVNHDDTISSNVLDAQSDQTSTLFRQYFGMDYLICLCWDCEAIRYAVDDLEDVENVNMTDLGTRVAKDVMLYRVLEIRRRKG